MVGAFEKAADDKELDDAGGNRSAEKGNGAGTGGI